MNYEALKWLKTNKNQSPFCSNRFNRQEAIDFVKMLYKKGATKVEISGAIKEEEEGPYADVMCVGLPKGRQEAIKLLVAIMYYGPEDARLIKPNVLEIWWD